MKLRNVLFLALSLALLASCAKQEPEGQRVYSIERIGPARVVQLYADGFESLPTRDKIFLYYLSQAAIAGRDIAIDQHHRSALEIRNILEGILMNPEGIDSTVIRQITHYTKLFWINNGMYDGLTSRKFVPMCSENEFKMATKQAEQNGARFGSAEGESLEQKLERLKDVIFNADYEPILTNKTPGQDWIKESTVNFYGKDVTYDEVDRWARAGREKNPLNSKVAKKDGRLIELVWRAGGENVPPGMYAADLEVCIEYLEMAIPYAANEYQRETIRKLIKYYRTGDLEDFRQFNIHWVSDTANIDFIHGFIEVYTDPRGAKGEYEAAIYWADQQLTKSIKSLSDKAQYFEDRMPWDDRYKKRDIKPLSARFVNIIMETGDAADPAIPIGINLPNEQSIREQYGTKSVVLANVKDALNKSRERDLLEEFAYDDEEKQLAEQYGSLASNLHTSMHEVLGHASGKVSEKLTKDPKDYLPGYYSTLEEARADLVSLWHFWDPKLVELGIIPSFDVAKAEYNVYVRNALLMQLRRIPKGDQIEQDHMKNRMMVAKYIMENSDAIAMEKRNGKTYVKVVDYEEMHEMVGKLLAEVMRIKAEGDFDAAKKLIDAYGLKFEPTLRDEVMERVKELDVASYTAFVMPKLVPVTLADGTITDVKVEYPLDLSKQMLEYSAFTKQEREKRMTASMVHP
ncbi:MAG: peptidase M49 [Bacteroidota bacterium]